MVDMELSGSSELSFIVERRNKFEEDNISSNKGLAPTFPNRRGSMSRDLAYSIPMRMDMEEKVSSGNSGIWNMISFPS